MTGADLLPRLAISVRQPWAHCIVHFRKDVENRVANSTAITGAMRLDHGASLAIHAAQGMTREEYEGARDWICSRGLVDLDLFPKPDELVRSAIVGHARFDGIAQLSTSPWFMGPFAIKLAEACPVGPIPCSGALGLFDWRKRPRPSAIETPKPWMTHWSGPANYGSIDSQRRS